MERFGTYKEKSLDLHYKFNKPKMQKKVRKEVEELVERMGITKEVVWREREKNSPSEEDFINPKKDKPEALVINPQGKPFGEEKRKQGQARVFILVDEEETKLDEAVKEVKAKATKVTKIAMEKPFGGTKPGKKFKIYELDDKPPMSLDQIVNEVIKNGNLRPLSEWYDNFDESGKGTLEESTIEYMNVYSKALNELMSVIPKSL